MINFQLSKVWILTPDTRRGFGGFWGSGESIKEAEDNAKKAGASRNDMKEKRLFLAHEKVYMSEEGMGLNFKWPGPESEDWGDIKEEDRPKDGMYLEIKLN